MTTCVLLACQGNSEPGAVTRQKVMPLIPTQRFCRIAAGDKIRACPSHLCEDCHPTRPGHRAEPGGPATLRILLPARANHEQLHYTEGRKSMERVDLEAIYEHGT